MHKTNFQKKKCVRFWGLSGAPVSLDKLNMFLLRQTTCNERLIRFLNSLSQIRLRIFKSEYKTAEFTFNPPNPVSALEAGNPGKFLC